MLNRRHIRIKVMQSLFAIKNETEPNTKESEKFLSNSLEQFYSLYLLLISLLIEIQKRAEDFSNKSKQKHLATSEDKNPNIKFINNTLLQLLKNNKSLQNQFEAKKITNWTIDNEYVEILFKEITNSNLYKDYMKNETSSFEDDKRFIIKIYQQIIAPNDKLYEYLEDKNLTWLDDFPIVNTTLVKLFNKVKPTSIDAFFAPNLYRDLSDKDFALSLLQLTLQNKESITQEISSRTLNWDAERIANVDYILLEMAICELQNFPSIPVKVTINEYLEIAKEYSTSKSSIFINGVLDKFVKDQEVKGLLNKTGRGLK